MVLEGVLALRIVTNGPVEYESARVHSLASLTAPATAAADVPGTARRLVFFARECLWWTTPRVTTDNLQTRMVTARTIIEGDGTGRQALQQPPDSADARMPIAYQPHMAPSQAAVIVRDVPPPLVGTQLTGIELRPTDDTTFQPLTIAGDPAAYERVIQRLSL